MKNTKDQDLTKVELLLTVNENIIVQRFFNVRNFKNIIKKQHYEFAAINFSTSSRSLKCSFVVPII